MAILKEVKEYEQQILNSLSLEYKGLKWCELGNQNFYIPGNHGTYVNTIAKEVYQSLEVEHISIDINGDNGSLPIDLDNPVPFIFLNQFDVITNYGTIEHVNNQYQIFKTVHDMCKAGGIMIHTFPPKEHWTKHCRYYYSEVFAKELANACNYQIVNYTLLNKDAYKTPFNLIAVTYAKNISTNNTFISKEEFDQVNGILDTGYMAFTGNYAADADYHAFISVIRKLPSPIRKIGKKFVKKLVEYYKR